MTPEHSSKPLEGGSVSAEDEGWGRHLSQSGEAPGPESREGEAGLGRGWDGIDQAASSWVGGRRGSRGEPGGVAWRAAREGERGAEYNLGDGGVSEGAGERERERH